MNSSVSNADVLYSVEATAWLLDMPRSEVHRAIRIGALHAVWRGGRPLIPAYVLVRLLGEPLPDPTHTPPDPRCGGQGGGGAR
jgi:hypothetical protein